MENEFLKEIHMTGADFKKDLNCMIDCVKVQPHVLFIIRPQLGPFLVLFCILLSYFWGWGQVQKLFWDLLT